MKRAIRILIPICIAIAILFCMAWYLMIYDRDFTRDVLLSSARFFENQGNHAISVWLYDLAYNQAEHNDDVAIELAQQYISSGNYSRAEYTLSNAIADGGGIDLYIELCRIYVEQDKLLDAVNMLANITMLAFRILLGVECLACGRQKHENAGGQVLLSPEQHDNENQGGAVPEQMRGKGSEQRCGIPAAQEGSD